MTTEERVKWNKLTKTKAVHILACIVSKSGKGFKEIKAGKEGRQKPGSVFVTQYNNKWSI